MRLAGPFLGTVGFRASVIKVFISVPCYIPSSLFRMSSLLSSQDLDAILYQWQVRNVNTSIYFAAAVAGLIATFALAHWTEYLFVKFGRHDSCLDTFSKSTIRPFIQLGRTMTVPGTPVVPGQIHIYLSYFTINAVLTFYDNPQKVGLHFIAMRFGWLVHSEVWSISFAY